MEKNMLDKIQISDGVKACFIPRVPFGVIYGGGEIQAERTLEVLNKMGNKAFWLDFSDKELFKHTDIFHFFGADFEFSFWINAIIRDRPVVVSSIFWEPSKLRRFLWRYGKLQRGTIPRKTLMLLQEATLILPNSKAEGKQIQEIFGISEDKIRVVPNGIDVDFIGKEPKKFLLHYLKDWPGDFPFVLCAGRIEERKNQLLLAESCLKIGVPLVLVGQKAPGMDLEYQEKLMKLVEKNPKYLKYLGAIPREEMPNAYAAATVHALVSSWETTGLVSLEAGLNGCNLVVGNCPPVREYFENIAEIVEQNTDSVAGGIERALQFPRNGFGQAEIIAQNYTWKRVAEETLKAYLEALEIYKK